MTKWIIVFLAIAALRAQETSSQTSDKPPEPMAGGFTDQPIENCYGPLQSVDPTAVEKLFLYKVINCQTQVVAGVNYKLTLVSPSDSQVTCILVLYQDLKGGISVSHPNEGKDCLAPN